MRRQNVLLLLASFLVVYWSAGQANMITAAKKPNAVELTCSAGEWESNGNEMLSLVYDDAQSGPYKCVTKDKNERRILVRIRNCENCMEVNTLSLTAIVIGNVLTTALVGWAVYTISALPKSKNISRSKASDRVNLINNGDGSTYQELNTGDRSEYSRLGGVRQK